MAKLIIKNEISPFLYIFFFRANHFPLQKILISGEYCFQAIFIEGFEAYAFIQFYFHTNL